MAWISRESLGDEESLNHEQLARLLGRPRYQRFSFDDKATRVLTG
ncbi:MAG: hypothetical protein VYA32_06825 [Planctomycetota bacterium]|nr:hypothetical protein [Planctomycetota bacterium]